MKQLIITGWFFVEVNNGPSYPAYVTTEVTPEGNSFYTVSVPEIEGRKGFSKLISTNTQIMFTPITEELCKKMVMTRKPLPFTPYMGELREEEY